MSCNDILPMGRDLGNSIIPRYTLKRAIALWTNTPHWVEQSSRMIDTIQVAINFGTEPAASHWMVTATAYTDCPPLVIYLRFQRTAVGAIMRASTIDKTEIATLLDLDRRFGGHATSFRYIPGLLFFDTVTVQHLIFARQEPKK